MQKIKKIVFLFILFLFTSFCFKGFASTVDFYPVEGWKKKNLNIYIENNVPLIKNIFNEWNNKADNLFLFSFVNTQDNADITVTFVDDKYKSYGALTKFYSHNNEIINTNIILPISTFNEKTINNELNIHIIKHEIGHSLGIQKHSTNEADVMYPYKTSKNSEITENDINLLKNPPKYSIKSINVENYKYDLPLLAKVYRHRGEYDKAIKIYDELLLKNKNLTQAIYLKGICYYEKKEFKKAYKLLKKAYNKEPKNLIYLNSYIKILCKLNKQKVAKKLIQKRLKDNPSIEENTLIKDSIRVLNKYNKDF